MIMEFKDEIGLSDDCYQKLINIVHRISDLDLPSVKKNKKYRALLLGTRSSYRRLWGAMDAK